MIEVIAETGSTNADLLARLAAGEAVGEGHWLVADRQVAGRGRFGRAWIDATGNFMGSTVVRIAPGQPAPPTLALVAGLALHGVLAALVPAPALAMLKWPNDVMVTGAGGGPAKLAGVLLERAGDSVVVGIGVNLAAAPDLPDRPALALSSFGPAPDRDTFAANLARAFAEDLARWRTWGLAPIIARWLAAAHPLGSELAVTDAGQGVLAGRFAGLDEHGALRLACADGTTRMIQAGDVALL